MWMEPHPDWPQLQHFAIVGDLGWTPRLIDPPSPGDHTLPHVSSETHGIGLAGSHCRLCTIDQCLHQRGQLPAVPGRVRASCCGKSPNLVKALRETCSTSLGDPLRIRHDLQALLSTRPSRAGALGRNSGVCSTPAQNPRAQWEVGWTNGSPPAAVPRDGLLPCGLPLLRELALRIDNRLLGFLDVLACCHNSLPGSLEE